MKAVLSLGSKLNEKVTIYADVAKKCKRGLQKHYDDIHKVFVGTGIVKMMRHQLFGENLLPS